jgi:hypothetical protein
VTTLASLEATISAALRDSSNATFTTTEVDALINQGIDAISAFYPKEVIDYTLTVSASAFSYTVPSTVSHIYRVDIWTSANTYRTTLPKANEVTEGPNSGWEFHGGILYFPPSYTYTAGDKIKLFGYGGFLQLSASSSTTDLDVSAIWALVAFCQNKAFGRLSMERGLFQQWQTQSGNSDVSMAALVQARAQARQEWRDEMVRLRRMRKG